MPIQLLQQMATERLPLDCTDDQLRDGLLVLRTAGLIAALSLRVPSADSEQRLSVTRVLAITPDGRRLLSRLAHNAFIPAESEVARPYT